MTSPMRPLPPTELRRSCDSGQFDFATTADLEPLEEIIGQDRAIEAIDYAVALDAPGYNVFVLGRNGTGRHTLVESTLKRTAAALTAPSDWCYVNNFDDPQKPGVLEFPAGAGVRFCRDMRAFIEEARVTLVAAFDSEEYQARRRAIETDFQDGQNAVMQRVQEQARERGVRIIQGPTGLVFAPLRDGEVLDPEAFGKLPETEQDEIRGAMQEVGRLMQQAMADAPKRIRDTRKAAFELDRETVSFAVGTLVDDLVSEYSGQNDVVAFLESLRTDLIEHHALLSNAADPEAPESAGEGPGPGRMATAVIENRYAVNVLVTHPPENGAPIVVEDHPSFARLTGRIEHRVSLGALSTDFTLIRGGALHQANGGYLVVEARRLLSEAFAWETLKRTLKSGHIRIESAAEMYSLSSTTSLDPDPVPLQLKVILIGDPQIYYLLQSADPEFGELFKVVADFDERMLRNDDTTRLFARAIASIIGNEGLRHADRDAVLRLIEESSRYANDSERLSSEIARTADMLRESDYCASRRGSGTMAAVDVQSALEARDRRVGRLRERVLEEINRDTILIATAGERIGQVNGLAVLQLGESTFGRPSRITARVALGAGKVIDIERESDLGGSLHSKGILILSGYIAAHYGADTPLSLSATIAFEQSYSGVDGDSASSAELYALLSAISGIPLHQGFAVTGSVNQFGEVQAIGGVNEKIEGFFDVCAGRGLTGDQGVLIPRSNVKHLMLRPRVVEACAAGQFAIYAVETVDQGLALLSGVDAGVKDPDGEYPEGTFNGKVRARLRELAQYRRNFAAKNDEDKQP